MVFGLLGFMAAEMGILVWFGWIAVGVLAVIVAYFVVRLIGRRAEKSRAATAGAGGD
jgi:hypothetical protein